MRGGYQILDLNDTNLVSGNGKTIGGIYDLIEGNYRKPILLSGLVIDGIEQADVFVQFTVSEDSFKTEIAQGSIVITDDDTLSYIANE